MVLPKEDDQHMPPDGKTQPSKESIKLIAVWIEKDLPVDKTIGELGLEKELFRSFFPKIEKNDYPDVQITEASVDSINLVKNTGLHVDPISESTAFLQVSAINKPNFTDADFEVLQSIAAQIAILDLGDTQVTDAIFQDLATLPNLTILKMDNTNITGEHINQLKTLDHLTSINLSYTQFKEDYLGQLADFKSLENVYLFNPSYGKSGSDTLNDGKITVEYGNYDLPKVARDSIVF